MSSPQHLAFPPVTAKDIGESLGKIGQVLSDNNLLQNKSLSTIQTEARRLKRLGDVEQWFLTIDSQSAIEFCPTQTRGGQDVYIRLYCDIHINQTSSGQPPFSSLALVLELYDKNDALLCRWHVDKANMTPKPQDGPLFHLQFGGHSPGTPGATFPVREPRWNHPPLDFILLSEMVAANFFCSTWKAFKNDIGWCEAISAAEKLCYGTYLTRLCSAVMTSGRTVLQQTWTDVWN